MELKFDERGLIPVIAQDYKTGEVRMLAYANREAIEKTLETGYAHYYSRSRQKIWKKGEASGELQKVREIRIDCDGDALIYVIEQEKNKACHTGERNCFYRNLKGEYVIKKPLPFEVLARLQEVINERLKTLPEGSYTAKLAREGIERIAQKFGEESVETLIAMVKKDNNQVVYESADMLYHWLLALSYLGIDVGEVLEELAKRFK
ncbi:MAG TPA: bifunctional phosphoribosyl-AMP cyclohydrolase/phosphoribosyl-ATP diphosphatase HisIE [Aquifex aeolicus]|uniref:Histidine biosynthesis bifunctional protein HisIE n=1 Tax=Aquifex aeolicus TaxID=63363 RepID=A0A9D1CF28_AQUAO|nr:bifunctional phosphoribosyl-AMP cyclohydrolase/phosphoribosyl-ATP diphosphatase HisIE [Aquificales bacterium]HIP86718.1 bifunctional phosphoribosyl-AMP cyclohydrolase/phosphoribosyl-ATP diphosphatase HisIE [Aquifex sp.]HIP97961.1 bifunctional phosphoribosyl-AMP cyclohydrolase/phosphoribosyl-ATP diphosphatase HisIE [Aquifex aeolicus]HIQ26338.1 bifunctional phosphoribosyl-AMP cyclohydrolase/phosphoribosyl-ATP diphosphatase HisIE [Aquifex aeolicus]